MSSRHELTGTFFGILPKCQWENDDGVTVTIIGNVGVPCPQCDGKGGVDSGGSNPDGSFIDVGCPECDGSGRVFTKIKGSIYPDQLVPNLTYRFYGQTKEHWKHGPQFCFEAFTVETPVGQEAVIAYLSQCNGIGPRTARAIWNEFGEESVKMLREHPGTVAEKTPRLSFEKAKEASGFLKSSEKTERTKMNLLGLLKGRGFPKKVLEWLIEDYGPAASTIVHRNPYILMKYKGCGFLKTDKMYLELRHNPSRMKRQALCAWHSVAKQSGGDTWCSFAVVRDGLRQNISSASVDVERAMQLAIRAGMLSETFHHGQRFVAEASKARDEIRISELIEEARQEFEKNVAPLLWKDVANSIAGITEHQRENAHLATSGFIGVLAGRPGTGKTYTVARIVSVLKNLFGEDQIAIAAPTGKAAVRVTAAMEMVGLSLRASTLHSLLGFQGSGFSFNRAKPLPYLFIVVDESSMIDAWMMRNLLDARAEGAHILFVGDPNQLAPVGHGAPLRDFIFANVPHGELKEIQRNSGRIVKACSQIIDRGRLSCSPKINLEEGENLLLIERNEPESQIDTLVAVIQKYQRESLAGGTEIDPIWDIQIIVAVNAKSPLGRKPLNQRMQELLNPNGDRVAGNPFRVGDKIINTKNASYKAVDLGADTEVEEDATTCYVANGEQAEVLSVDPAKIIARLTSPDRTILIPRSAKSADAADESDGGSSGSGDEESEEATGSGCAWELGYCISGHKSQGSEWPIVIVMLDEYNGAKRVESKQWIYTAISRAKRICLLIGRQRAGDEMCGRDALFRRKTFLKEWIVDLRAKAEVIDSEPLAPLQFMTEEFFEQLLEGVC